jgi:hypothetical protein
MAKRETVVPSIPQMGTPQAPQPASTGQPNWPQPVQSPVPVAPPVQQAPPVQNPYALPPQAEQPQWPPQVATHEPAQQAWVPPAPPAATPPSAWSPPPVATTPPIAAPPSLVGGGVGGNLLSMMRQDMSGIQDINFKILDTKIEYEAEITKAEGKVAESGNSMIALELIITFPVADAGVKLFDNCVFTAQSMWKFKSLCKSTNLLDPTGSVFVGNNEKDFEGSIVRFNIRHDDYNSQTRNKVAGGYVEGWQTPGLSGTPQA